MENRKPRSGGLAWFLFGLVLGIAATIYLPRHLEPYVPFVQRKTLTGFVTNKKMEGDRLLLRLETDQGLVLAVFVDDREKVDLLVEKGNEVQLKVDGYQPFIENPVVSRVSVGTAGHPSPETPEMPMKEDLVTPVGRGSAGAEEEAATEWLAFAGSAREDKGTFVLAGPNGIPFLRITGENVQTGNEGVRVRTNAPVELLESFEPLPLSEPTGDISAQCKEGQLSCFAGLLICSDEPRVLGGCTPQP